MVIDKNQHGVKKYDMCSKDHFLVVKGICILAALIAAFCQAYLGYQKAVMIVYIASSAFVLCSGFGVAESYRRKGTLIHFWENKMLKLWIPSVLVLLAMNLLTKKNYTSWIAQSPLGLKGDILYVIMSGYAVFWLAYRVLESRKTRITVIFVVAAAALILIPKTLSVRYQVLAFPVGILLSQINWKRKVMHAPWWGKLLMLVAGIVTSAVCWFLAKKLQIPVVQPALWATSFIAIALSLILVTYYLQKLMLGVFAPFGMMAYGIYLTYEDVFKIFAGKKDWRIYVVMFAAIFGAAAAITWVRFLILRGNQKLRKRNKTRLKGKR